MSAAFALRDVIAVLSPEIRRVHISKMSDAEPVSLKSADIVYIGYLSGLGMLQDMVLKGSRFAIGASYDEVIDKATRHTCISQAGSQYLGEPQPDGGDTSYRDYGVFAKFRGPGGNSIVVISGTRDEGVQQTAEDFTSPERLSEFS